MTDDKLEYYAGLSLVAFLNDLALVSTPVQVQGHRPPMDPSIEEWLVLDVSNIVRRPSRNSLWWGVLAVRIACVSRLATQRTDDLTVAPWKLASRVRFGLEKKSIPVKQMDTSAQTTIAYLKMSEADMDYEPDVAELPSSTHSVVLTVSGRLTKSD